MNINIEKYEKLEKNKLGTKRYFNSPDFFYGYLAATYRERQYFFEIITITNLF